MALLLVPRLCIDISWHRNVLVCVDGNVPQHIPMNNKDWNATTRRLISLRCCTFQRTMFYIFVVIDEELRRTCVCLSKRRFRSRHASHKTRATFQRGKIADVQQNDAFRNSIQYKHMNQERGRDDIFLDDAKKRTSDP